MLRFHIAVALAPFFCALQARGGEFLYGIHDFDPRPDGFLSVLEAAGVRGTVVATEAIGHDPNDRSGKDYTPLAGRGYRIIARLNNGYGSSGTIPPARHWDDFARRCANFAAASRGCHIWVIGNETNLWGEWPADQRGYRRVIMPEDYAECFRRVYNRIKAVRPADQVIPQALAPFAGPYGAGPEHDAMPIDHVTYMRRMLTAISTSGDLDGIALHVTSRGYRREDVFSTQKVNGNYWSFFCYKDWLERGIPENLRHLPVYVTECNGYYYWKGGHPEAPSETYHAGWVQTVLLEIDRWNHNEAIVEGKPIIRSLCFYRWCAWCDGWNIDGAPQESRIMADLAEAASYKLAPPRRTEEPTVPFTITIGRKTPPLQKDVGPYYGVWRSFPFRLSGSRTREVVFKLKGSARQGADDDDARLLLDLDDPQDETTWNSEAALDGSRDRGRTAEAVIRRRISPGRHVLRLQVDGSPFIESVTVEFQIPKESFRRADANADGVADIADAVFILQYLFALGAFPPCLDAADTNDDGALDLSDAVFLLSHLFAAQTTIPQPASRCGPDPTADTLSCKSFPPCRKSYAGAPDFLH